MVLRQLPSRKTNPNPNPNQWAIFIYKYQITHYVHDTCKTHYIRTTAQIQILY